MLLSWSNGEVILIDIDDSQVDAALCAEFRTLSICDEKNYDQF